nr:immunoglobulin light chain junction region [Macaca mulatta]
CQHSYGAPHSF